MATAIVSAAAASQQALTPTAWQGLPITPAVSSSAVKGQGKLVSYDEGPTWHVFCAVTRRWHTTVKSPVASPRLFNDCAIILEPGICRAFSAYSGQFTDIGLSGPSTVLNPVGNKNDSIVLIVSGNQLHAFSAFCGTWTTRAISSSGSFGAVTRRHVALLQDGMTISAMSAFDGQWHDLTTTTAISQIDADGTAAFASNALETFAFSAHTRTWRSATTLPNATFVRGDDWGLWLANGNVLAFSGLRGDFVSDSPGATAIAESTDLFALLNTPAGYRAYSAITNDLMTIAGPAASIDLGSASALLHDATGVRGYSPLMQQTEYLPVAASTSGAGNSVGFATTATGATFAWSSLTARWYQAPTSTNGSLPTLTTTTIGLASPTDYYAFAARSGQFVARGRTLPTVVANPTSAPLLGYGPTTLVAFDPDGERWVSTARQSSTPPWFRIWRTSSLAIDGTTAHGFGAQTAAWYSYNLPTGSVTAISNSEVAYVTNNNLIAACGMVPEIVTYQQFPHFRRLQPRGAEIQFAAALPKNAIGIAAFAPLTPEVVVPGLGGLLLDASAAILIPVRPSTTRRVARLSLRLSADAALPGSMLASQMVIIPSNGPPYLSSRATVHLW